MNKRQIIFLLHMLKNITYYAMLIIASPFIFILSLALLPLFIVRFAASTCTGFLDAILG